MPHIHDVVLQMPRMVIMDAAGPLVVQNCTDSVAPKLCLPIYFVLRTTPFGAKKVVGALDVRFWFWGHFDLHYCAFFLVHGWVPSVFLLLVFVYGLP